MALLLLLALAAAAPGRAQKAPSPTPAAHNITVAGPAAHADYDAALRAYHERRYEEAVASFQRATRKDARCAMAFLGASRALQRRGDSDGALAALASAESLRARLTDPEVRFIEGWAADLRSAGKPDAERRAGIQSAQRALDTALILYPYDPELWVARAETETNRLRAVPFYLAALRLAPNHPGRKSWDLSAPPPPDVTPVGWEWVGPLANPPRLFEGLGELTHPVTTNSSTAQAYYEQGLRCWHAYVRPAAIANFQQAANLDPKMAMAYWGLSLTLPASGGPITRQAAANRGLQLAQRTNERERRFCAARVLELGGKEQRESFLDALDGAIAASPDDVELWIWRGKALGAGDGNVPLDAMLYQIAANRMHPEHPGPNHELIHAYEGVNRPVLGWAFCEGFERSAPNMPHAHHMMAHLATRLGRWDEALRCTRMSVAKSKEGYPELDPSHHIDIMIRALAHEGRFIEAFAEPRAYRNGLPWARLLRLKGDLVMLADWAEQRRENRSPDGTYVAAVVMLDRGDLNRAEPLVQEVEQRNNEKQGDFYRYAELRGRFLVQKGDVDPGLALLKQAADRAVKDTSAHAWGGGSYMLEVWGETALRSGRLDQAEEAFLEAMAHEHGCIIGALGLLVVAERRSQPEIARHYWARATSIWHNADPGVIETQLERIRGLGQS